MFHGVYWCIQTKMGIKYKLKLKDLKLEYLIEYFSPLIKYLSPKKKLIIIQILKNLLKKNPHGLVRKHSTVILKQEWEQNMY